MASKFAISVLFSAGMVTGTALSHPVNVYPSFEGFAGAVIALLNSCVIDGIKEPPSVSKVIVYVLIVKRA